jgi:hypothetical protein
VECIGWLELGQPFKCAVRQAALLEKLIAIMKRETVNVMRGTHDCEFRGGAEVGLEGRSLLLGHAEIWVPSQTRNVIFAAPTLIYHYCEAHEYCPPDEFVDAVMEFELSSNWSGVAESKQRIHDLYQQN